MNDANLIELFRPIIVTGLVSAGYADVNVLQANQPTQQGVPTTPSIFFYKLGDRRYGFLRRDDVWNRGTSQMEHIETQFYETTFQVSALVLQNVLATNGYTASDLLNEVAMIMQSDRTRAILKQADVAILRVTDVRNPYFTDDRDQFEASPSFDFVLTHSQIRESVNATVDTIELDVYRV